jgi:hypothetical protein
MEHCAGIRAIANHAIDPAAVELNRSGPQYVIANDRPLFHKHSFNEALKS